MFKLVNQLRYHSQKIVADIFKIKDIIRTKETPPKALIQGWVRSVRNHKQKVFIDVNDGSCFQSLQVVIPADLYESKIQYGTTVSVIGDVIETDLHRDGIEMVCKEISVIGPCDPDKYPFQYKKNHEMQHLRLYPHLRTRQRQFGSVLKVRNSLEMSLHRYFQENGFLHIHTPVITSSDCEGAGEMFNITTPNHDNTPTAQNTSSIHVDEGENRHFFDTETHLSVSSQLHLEACSLGLGQVYTINPAFRAELGLSRNHLSEFRMLEVEVAFSKSLEDIITIMEESVKYCISKTLDSCDAETADFHTKEYKNMLVDAATTAYTRMSYTEAVSILRKKTRKLKSVKAEWGIDFNNEQEEFLSKHCGNKPLFITDFPSGIKPFYMLTNQDDKTVAAVDLILPHCGELCGGSLREHRLDVLKKRMKDMDMNSEKYQWYLDLRRFGNAPHGGYGMGFDRLVRFFLGIHNIRDAVPFPRYSHSCLL